MNSHNEIHDSDHDIDDDEYTSADDSAADSADDSEYSEESIESFRGDLTQLRRIVSSINSTIETLETQLISIQRPIEALHMEQLGDVPFLETSPFRHTMFKFKTDVGIPGFDSGKRYMFADIMKHVRTYLFETGAVQSDGSIKLTSETRKLFGIKEKNERIVSYIDIMHYMRQILQ
jgi:hypothetical protein